MNQYDIDDKREKITELVAKFNNNKKFYTSKKFKEQKAVEVITNLKLDYDWARLQLIDYQLADLITNYETLKELRNQIQQKFFLVFETIKENC